MIQTGKSQVPVQKEGTKIDTVKQKRCKSAEHAAMVYSVARRRLLDINSWGEVAKLPLSSFKLFDATGIAVNRPAQEGDFIRIDIPGPGTKVGHGYDWVVVESIFEQEEKDEVSISLRVRPCPHPLGKDEQIAHFLKPEATSTFQVKRSNNVVTAGEHGRNEMVNNQSKHMLDNIRNAIVGICSKFGLAYPQWKSLVEGLLRT